MDRSDRRDLRYASKAEKLEIRKIVFTLSKLSYSVPAIAALLKVRRSTVKRWVNLCAQGGSEALEERPRAGRPRKLSPEIVRWMVETVSASDQAQSQNGFACWTGARLRQAVIDRFGVDVSVWTIRRAMRREGLAPQRMQPGSARRAGDGQVDSSPAALPMSRNGGSGAHGRNGRKPAAAGNEPRSR